jgi:SAM-dependent methyltransferase
MKKNHISELLQKHYKSAITQHGPTAKGVDWGDDRTAEIRHKQMRKVIVSCDRKISLLDVGCGYGAFYDYLKSEQIDVDYLGIDVVEEMVDLARKKHIQGTFIHTDFLSYDSALAFDYAICNGILTQKLDVSLLDMECFAKEIIKKMFNVSKIGCCFNVMSTRCNFFAPNLFYRHPSEILSYCLNEITNNVVIDHSYGLYEFTVYIYK